jgi:hypothetical protein
MEGLNYFTCACNLSAGVVVWITAAIASPDNITLGIVQASFPLNLLLCHFHKTGRASRWLWGKTFLFKYYLKFCMKRMMLINLTSSSLYILDVSRIGISCMKIWPHFSSNSVWLMVSSCCPGENKNILFAKAYLANIKW